MPQSGKVGGGRVDAGRPEDLVQVVDDLGSITSTDLGQVKTDGCFEARFGNEVHAKPLECSFFAQATFVL